MKTPRWVAYFCPLPWESRSQRRFHWMFMGCLAVIVLNALFQIVVEVITRGQPFPS